MRLTWDVIQATAIAFVGSSRKSVQKNLRIGSSGLGLDKQASCGEEMNHTGPGEQGVCRQLTGDTLRWIGKELQRSAEE